MENTFDYSQSIECKGFDTLNYEDIKGTDESIPVASWKDFVTPNNSIPSFAYSSISSFSSPNTLADFKKKMDVVKQSVEFYKSQLGDLPLTSSIPPLYNPSDSNEFLRKKTHLADRESLRKSACNILDLALTGQSEEGLPDKVTPDLLVEVIKKASKDLKVKPTIEHLLKFVQILKDDDIQMTPKTGDQTIMQTKLKQSESHITSLNRKVAECVDQIKVLSEVVAESMQVLKTMNEKRAYDKSEAKRLTEELNKVKEENLIIKQDFNDSQKKVDQFKRKSEEGPDEGKIESLVKENLQLKMQIKQNLETFDKLAEKVASAEKVRKVLVEKEKEVELMRKDKKELVEAVELLVQSAQRIMESSRGSDKFPSLDQFLSKTSNSLFNS